MNVEIDGCVFMSILMHKQTVNCIEPGFGLAITVHDDCAVAPLHPLQILPLVVSVVFCIFLELILARADLRRPFNAPFCKRQPDWSIVCHVT